MSRMAWPDYSYGQFPGSQQTSDGTMQYDHINQMQMDGVSAQAIIDLNRQHSLPRTSTDSGYDGDEGDCAVKQPEQHGISNMNYDANLGMQTFVAPSMDFGSSFGANGLHMGQHQHVPNTAMMFPMLNYAMPMQQQSRPLLRHTQSENIATQNMFSPMTDNFQIKSEDQALRPIHHAPSIFSQPNYAMTTSPQSQPGWELAKPVTFDTNFKRRSTTEASTSRRKVFDPLAAVPQGKHRVRKRVPHTAVEKRYRENLNLHLDMLRTAVPTLRPTQRKRSDAPAGSKLASKCDVLMGAVEYIKKLETENERLKGEGVTKS